MENSILQFLVMKYDLQNQYKCQSNIFRTKQYPNFFVKALNNFHVECINMNTKS